MKLTSLRDYRPVVGGTIALLSLAGLLALFHFQGAQVLPPVGSTPTGVSRPIQQSFTPPGDESQPAEDDLVRAIDEARFTVDVASYSFNLWSMRQALLRAHRRGVEVRMVVDSDHLPEPEVAQLLEAGIPVIGDRGPGLMHHKFVVIDGLDTWTGSMNLTYGSARVDHNNWARLRSAQVAEDFRREFDEMFVEDRFGPASKADTPYPRLQIDGTDLEVMFSPDDRVAARLVALLRGARRSIDVMAYSFTADALAEAMLDRAHAGVRVRGVLDEGQSTATGAEFSRLQQAGLDVRLDRSDGLLHHKVIVIDGETVITGSYNFTRSAEEQNDEAVLVLHNPELAQEYLEEFEMLFDAAGP
jgi:phosphatidylserine/phosphatidylglycerophosphate/cardiolipin synthase-like enzyme